MSRPNLGTRGPRKRRGLKHGLAYTPEYRAWQTMRHRCLDETSPAWKDYGGRGITIHESWIEDPAAFVAHVGKRPSRKHELDRIDNNRGYEPGNVRWAPRVRNCRNRRSNRLVTYDGETKTLSDWCSLRGIAVDTLKWRLNNGWSVHKALFTPVRPKRGTKPRKFPVKL